jgi:hypothetical protein
MAVSFNSDKVGIPEAAGGERVIEYQLRSTTYKEELVALQGINHSVYSEMDPLHLPKVLSLIGRRYGQTDVYVALLSSIK